MEQYHASLVDSTELYDSLMCLSLIGPSAPKVLASWVSLPAWTPIMAGSSALYGPDGFSTGDRISAAGCKQGRKLFTAFSAISGPFKGRLRLVMQRLISAMRRVTLVDAAIDLGISIEALYLSDMQDDRGELSFRLRTRAARLLARTESERKKIFVLMGDIYGMRSSAVHTGAVRATCRGKPSQEVLQLGFSLTAETVRRFIAVGEPNWDKVMFG